MSFKKIRQGFTTSTIWHSLTAQLLDTLIFLFLRKMDGIHRIAV